MGWLKTNESYWLNTKYIDQVFCSPASDNKMNLKVMSIRGFEHLIHRYDVPDDIDTQEKFDMFKSDLCLSLIKNIEGQTFVVT